MNHLTNVYKHKCEQLQEQIYRLTRMFNEAASPPTIAPLDQSYPNQDGGGATDVFGNPLSGPNYKFPPPPIPGQASGGEGSFFPRGLSRTVGPEASDYPGGDRNLQYLNDMQQWIIACRSYDEYARVHGTGRKPTNFGPIRKVVDVFNDISSPNFGRNR